MMTTQLEELEAAAKEGRQPLCVACGQPLDVVEQEQNTYLLWRWDAAKRRYNKGEEESESVRPYHNECGCEDWDLVDSGAASEALGLTY